MRIHARRRHDHAWPATQFLFVLPQVMGRERGLGIGNAHDITTWFGSRLRTGMLTADSMKARSSHCAAVKGAKDFDEVWSHLAGHGCGKPVSSVQLHRGPDRLPALEYARSPHAPRLARTPAAAAPGVCRAAGHQPAPGCATRVCVVPDPRATQARRRDAPWLAHGTTSRCRWRDPTGSRCMNGEPGPRTVVILHGWGSHAARFAPLAQSLVAQGWRVLAIDAPGHGSSPGRRSSLPQFIARARPGDPGSGAGTGTDRAFAGRPGRRQLAWPIRRRRVAPQSGTWCSSAAPPACHFSSTISLPCSNSMRRRRATCWRDSRIASTSSRISWSATAHAADITVPVLLIHDRDDDVIPFAHSEQLLAVLPACKAAGHPGTWP